METCHESLLAEERARKLVQVKENLIKRGSSYIDSPVYGAN